jgi:hypothetical protein
VASPLPIAGTCLVLVAIGVQGFAAWQAVASFDGSAVGKDETTRARARFAGVRTALPSGSIVRVLRQERPLGDEVTAIAAALAPQLHRHLAGLPIEPGSGVDPAIVRQIATGFRQLHTAEANADPATVHANLLAWWTGLEGELYLSRVRFAMAPHLVTTGPADWTVGDFADGHDWRGQANAMGLEFVSDHGGGVVLFRKRP